MKHCRKTRARRVAPWLLLVGSALPAVAQTGDCTAWNNNEIAVEVSGAALDLRVFNQAGSQIHFTTVTPQTGCDWYGDLGGGTGVALPWEVLTFEFSSSSDVITVYTYTPGYKASQPLSFFYPSGSTATDHRVRFVLNTTTERVRAQWPATSSQFLNTLLGDATWVWPYDDDAFCDAASCAVTTPSAGPFLALVTAVPSPGAPADYTFHDSDVTMSGETWVWGESGQVLRFRAGRALVVDGTLTANGVTFRRGTIGQDWAGIRVAEGTLNTTGGRVERADVGIRVYEPATATITDATIELNDTGLDVLTRQGVTVAGGLFDGNDYGVTSDFSECYSPGCLCTTNCRSRFSFVESALGGALITGSSIDGVYVLNADVSMVEIGIKHNGGSGLVVANGLVDRLEGSELSGNGAATTGSGISVLSLGDVRISPLDNPGLNRVRDNDGDEVAIYSGGAVFAGSEPPTGFNAFTDPDPMSSALMSSHASNPKTLARCNWWGTSSGPAGQVVGLIEYEPFLLADPTTDPDCIASLTRATAGRGGGNVHERLAWLRGEIQRLRDSLLVSPGAPGEAGLVRELFGMQRLDRTDDLGERSATLAVLTSLRLRLIEPTVPPARRPAAEAALVAEAYDALTREEYDAARGLLEAFGLHVLDATERRQLTLIGAYLLAQAGRYADAAVQVSMVAATTPAPGEARALRELAARFLERAASRAATTSFIDATGVDALPQESAGLTVRPNPARELAVVSMFMEEPARVRLTLHDVLGRMIVVAHEGGLAPGMHYVPLNVGALPNGVYLVRIVTSQQGQSIHSARRLTISR